MKTTEKHQLPFTHMDVQSLQSHNNNPLGLIYREALTANEKGKGNRHPITYMLNGLKIAANVYTISGATHIQTYWKPEYVNQAITKLTDFFGKRL